MHLWPCWWAPLNGSGWPLVLWEAKYALPNALWNGCGISLCNPRDLLTVAYCVVPMHRALSHFFPLPDFALRNGFCPLHGLAAFLSPSLGLWTLYLPHSLAPAVQIISLILWSSQNTWMLIWLYLKDMASSGSPYYSTILTLPPKAHFCNCVTSNLAGVI